MTFFDRDTNFPWQSHGLWWISQFRRWGMVGADVDYTAIVNKVNRADIFREVAKDLGVATPAADLKAEVFFDGVAFDPADPEKYAKSFTVNNLT